MGSCSSEKGAATRTGIKEILSFQSYLALSSVIYSANILFHNDCYKLDATIVAVQCALNFLNCTYMVTRELIPKKMKLVKENYTRRGKHIQYWHHITIESSNL